MNKHLTIDLLLVTFLMAAALCVARGFLQSSLACFFGAWVLALGAVMLYLESMRARRETLSLSDDDSRPRTAHFK